MQFTAYCRQCGHKHHIDQNPAAPDNQVMDWYTKHAEHEGVGLLNTRDNPRRSLRLLSQGWRQAAQFWDYLKGRRFLGLPEALRGFGMPVPITQLHLLNYLQNANVNIAYGAAAAYTITLASLATSSTLVAGRNGTNLTNSSNKYLDYFLAGLITTGTSPNVSTNIEAWLLAALDDTPTWPDSLTNTDAAFTTTSRNQLFTYGAPLFSAIVTASSNVGYPFRPQSVASLFGGICPRDFVPWVTHNTAVNLNGTAGNHFIKYLGITLTVV